MHDVKKHFSHFFTGGFSRPLGKSGKQFSLFRMLKILHSAAPIEDTPRLVSKSRFCTPRDFISLYNEEFVAPITIKIFIMKKSRIIYLPTREKFENRKEAKQTIGHAKYNKAVKNGEVVFITTYDFGSIII